MIELATECADSERINAFLANRLEASGRQDFLAHLGVCEACASLLHDLRDDERLAQAPLTAKERSQIRSIVQQVSQELSVRLDRDRQGREESKHADQGVSFHAPSFGEPRRELWRAVWLALAAVVLLAVAGWWLTRQ